MSRKVTLFLIIICFIAYPFGLKYSALSCSYDNIFSSGNWWSVFTSLFLHGSTLHLLGNMLFLYLFGSALEKHVGAAKLLIIFIAGGAISMFLSIFYYPHDLPSLGASGAISTILAILMLFNPWKISFLLNFFPMPLGVAGFTFCLVNLGGFFQDHYNPPVGGLQVAYLAHLIGFLVGIIFGIILSPSWKKNLLLSILQFIGYYFLLVLIYYYLANR